MLEVVPVVTLVALATSHRPRLAAAVTTNGVDRSEPRAFRGAGLCYLATPSDPRLVALQRRGVRLAAQPLY
jgi:hypothetical protein